MKTRKFLVGFVLIIYKLIFQNCDTNCTTNPIRISPMSTKNHSFNTYGTHIYTNIRMYVYLIHTHTHTIYIFQYSRSRLVELEKRRN